MAKSRQSAIDRVAPFREQLISALDHINDQNWLETNSPLASPYFLGDYLSNKSDLRPAAALRYLLLEISTELPTRLKPEKRSYLSELIKYSFFEPKSWQDICYEFAVSKPTFYRHRNEAIQYLEETLIQKLRPALRLEDPPRPETPLYGRKKVSDVILENLAQNFLVGITGAGGIGKSFLAAHIAQTWQSQRKGAIFWLSICPGLNDHLLSILFSLGRFLQQNGQPNVLLQLLADTDQGKSLTQASNLLGLVRYAFKNLDTSPLLCFDEIDLLKPEIESHNQIINFISSLSGTIPILITGQRLFIQVDAVYQLDGLALDATRTILQDEAIVLDSAETNRLHKFTNGNPRLIEMFASLYRNSTDIGEILHELLPSTPSVQALLQRIWFRLNEDEQQLLAALSVFRRPAPSDCCSGPRIITRLLDNHLIHQDSQGGISLAPIFKKLISDLISPEERERFHLEAAQIRADRADYTAAAYHYIEGGDAENAIWLWYNNLQREINQGQARTALGLFSNLSRNQFVDETQEALVVMRSELRILVGELTTAQRDLKSVRWKTPIFTVKARQLEGNIAVIKGQIDYSIQHYENSIEVIQGELSKSYSYIASSNIRKGDFEHAWHQSLFAKFEVERIQADILKWQGKYEKSIEHYKIALEIAESIGHEHGIGIIHNNLMSCLSRQGNFEEAKIHAERAMETAGKIGDVRLKAFSQVNLGSALRDAGIHQEAIEHLLGGYQAFTQLGSSVGIAPAAIMLAEVYLDIGELETATEYAWRSIDQEEISFLAGGFGVLAEISLAKVELSDAVTFGLQSIEFAQMSQDTFNQAYSLKTLGTIYSKQNETDKMMAAYEEARQLFIDLKLDHEVEQVEALMTSTSYSS